MTARATESVLKEVPGGQALADWFGGVPSFHDAYLLEIGLSGGRAGSTALMRIHAWGYTGDRDAKGFHILDRHVVVTLHLEGISTFACTDFHTMPAIIFDLDLTWIEAAGKEHVAPGPHIQIEWDSSYGVEGTVTAKAVRITFEPGKPGEDLPRSIRHRHARAWPGYPRRGAMPRKAPST